MPFFQNPFAEDFYACWLLSDRTYNPDYKCPRNAGRGSEVVSVWNEPPYDLSGNDSDGNAKNVLNLSFAINDYKNWTNVAVTISASSLSSTQVSEIMSSLTSNSLFNDYFNVTITNKFNSGNQRIAITQKMPHTRMKFYINNGQAESVLAFNKKAGVAELPSFFARHTIANRFTYSDSQNALIELDPGTYNIDASLIDNAVNAQGISLGYSHSTVQADWQLLGGKSGIFTFQKITVDGSDRITLIIEYPAGAKAGDMGRKIAYSYSGSNTNPSQITEYPYILTSGDLVTP